MPDFLTAKDIEKIQEAGSTWATRCMNSLFSAKDLQFFATEYRPFYETFREIEGILRTSLDSFDPFAQHKLCRTLFAPAFGTHGALMVSSPNSPMGRVPNFNFAAFEKGAIQAIRQKWKARRKAK